VVRLIVELAAMAMWAIGFAIVGGVIGVLVCATCGWVGLVNPEYPEGLFGSLVSMAIGALVGALIGLAWSARRQDRLTSD
jgi:membrane protein DedA with SNARE-associated domain